MDSTKAKIFLLVEKYKSFSKVAEEFSYTPSAISHIADALEDELQIKLFKRTNKGVDITKEGSELMPHFEAILRAEDELKKSAEAISQNKKYSLKIGAYSSIALYLLPEILQSFKRSYPQIKTTILVDDNMHNWLEDKTVDIIFADDLLGVKKCYPFMEDEFVAVVPKDEFSDVEEIDLNDLYSYPFIYNGDKTLDNYLDCSRFKEVIPVKSIENSSVVYMVKEKLGVTILPSLSAKIFVDGVKSIKLTPSLSRTIGLVYDKKSPSWACERFVAHIKKISIKA